MILLTGAAGYLGQHVFSLLLQRRCATIAVGRFDCDLTDAIATETLLRDAAPDVVIHLACHVPKQPEAYHDRGEGVESVAMAAHVCARGVPVIFASSQTAEHPVSCYAESKRVAEGYVRIGAILRLPGLFGLPRRNGVIYHAARNGIIPVTFGPFTAMHVRDAAEYLVRAALAPVDAPPMPMHVDYGNAELEARYGSLGQTFQSRMIEFVADVAEDRWAS